MSALAQMRMLTAMMPEQMLIEKAIEALQEYSEKKFGKPSENLEENFDSIKDFLSGKSPSVTEEKVIKPVAELTVILMKWEDEGRDMREIMEDSEKFHQEQKDKE